MTQTAHTPPPQQPLYPPSTPPPGYGAGLPPTGGPVPPPLAGQEHPRRARRGPVMIAAAVLASGLLGGVTGALVGGSSDPAPTGNPTAPIAQNVSANTPGDVSAIADKVLPSVVQVNVRSGNAQGLGSGVILSADGKILTNNHVVAGARQVSVTLNDGRTLQADVVGTDPASDLAVLQARGASDLTPATLGDSSKVKVGDQVVAIGSPAGLQGTVTTGIVSALNRDVTVSEDQGNNPYVRGGGGEQTSYKAIQTDASINQGNSGGALVNSKGEVIGINSAMYSPVATPDGKAGSVGIGFAIPVNDAKAVADRIS